MRRKMCPGNSLKVAIQVLANILSGIAVFPQPSRGCFDNGVVKLLDERFANEGSGSRESHLSEDTTMAVDMFLKLDGIKGESKDHKHKDEIHIESFIWGMKPTGAHRAGGGGGAGKVQVHDISITKFVDKSSASLMLACCNGKHIKEGLITVRKAGEKPLEYLKIKLEDILISGVQVAGHGGDLLTENCTLNFSKVKVEYQEQKPDGTGSPAGEMGWDVKKNEKQ